MSKPKTNSTNVVFPEPDSPVIPTQSLEFIKKSILSRIFFLLFLKAKEHLSKDILMKGSFKLFVSLILHNLLEIC